MHEWVSEFCAFFWVIFLLLVCLVQLQWDSFVLSYYIFFLYYSVLSLLLRSLLFSHEKQTSSVSRVDGKWEELEAVEGE